MDLFDFSALLSIPATVKVIDAYRQLVLERDWRKFGFTVGAWVVGIGLAFLVAESSIELPVLGWADLVLVGIGLGSSASVINDFARRGGVEYVTLNADVELLDEPVDGTPPGIE